MLATWVLVATLLTDVGPRRPSAVVAECASDRDCTLGVRGPCCTAECCPALQPMTSVEANRHARQCLSQDCATPDCATAQCPPLTYAAACRAGRCVSQPLPSTPTRAPPPKPAPPPAPTPPVSASDDCRTDDQCVLTTLGPSCCPRCCPKVTAQTPAQLREYEQRCAAAGACMPLTCEACVNFETVADFVPVCRAGHCAAERKADKKKIEPKRKDPIPVEPKVEPPLEPKLKPGPTTNAPCASDDECVMTAWAGCCGSCCPPEPRATLKAVLEREQGVCASVACAVRNCRAMLCKQAPPVSAFRAVCVAGTCEARPAREVSPPAPRLPMKDLNWCESDSECTVSNVSRCCTQCCPEAPFGTTQAAIKALRAECRETMCPMVRCAQDRCPAVPTLSDVNAVCRDHRCTVVRKGSDAPEAPGQCQRDDQCRVSYPPVPPSDPCHTSACGCCPSTTPVVEPTAGAPVPLEKQPKPKLLKFGLSQPDQPNVPVDRPLPRQPTAPNCSPCPAPTPASAVCREGRCMLAVPRGD